MSRINHGLMSPSQLFQRPPLLHGDTPLKPTIPPLATAPPVVLPKLELGPGVISGKARPKVSLGLSMIPELNTKYGDKGPDAKELQFRLKLLGESLGVDGDFGKGTQAAIKSFQTKNGLKASGVLNKPTQDKIIQQLNQLKLSANAEGPSVQYLQHCLSGLGYDLEKSGKLDSASLNALNHYLKDQLLPTNTPIDFEVLSNLQSELSKSESIYGRSNNHSVHKFIPEYPMTAYHESGQYRTKSDPYAVGAITNPTKKGDLGGKTYGTYQFESFVHSGSKKNTKAAKGSTLMRFITWDKNPYGKELKAAADKHGLASSQFDAAWKEIAKNNNKPFGKMQEAFLLIDKMDDANAFMARAGISESVKKDPRIVDLVLGSANHAGTLIDGMADDLKRMQSKRKYSANELGRVITDYKHNKVTRWWRSSSDAWAGLRARFKAEKKVFSPS